MANTSDLHANASDLGEMRVSGRRLTNYQIANKLREILGQYKKENGINEYTEQTVLDDLLYFVGEAISDEYKFSPGFDLFKQRLREHLGEV